MQQLICAVWAMLKWGKPIFACGSSLISWLWHGELNIYNSKIHDENFRIVGWKWGLVEAAVFIYLFIIIYCLKIYGLTVKFFAAHVLSWSRVWLYQPLWFCITDKQGCFARVYHSSSLMLALSPDRPLVYVTVVWSIPVLQCETVSV